MRYLLIFALAILFQSCDTPWGYKSKGFFLPVNSLGERAEFATTLPYTPNRLPKITQGGLQYFVWKTVKYNVNLHGESFSSYKTYQYSNAATLSPEEEQYLRTAGNLLNNYLFFIDDYRFIYLSEDDWRNENSDGFLPLYFDDKEYKLKGLQKSASEQLIRGYYSIKDNSIFLDFGGIKHFYVKASYDAQSITFDSIFIPEKRTLKASGLRNPYVAFSEMLSANAQPVFEKPLESDLIREPEFVLELGFFRSVVKPSKRNVLHQSCLEAYADYGNVKFEKIDTIIYNFDRPMRPTRTYVTEVTVDQMRYDTFEVVEDLREVPTW